MPKLQITTEEAKLIIALWGNKAGSLRAHIQQDIDQNIPCIFGLPAKQDIEGKTFQDSLGHNMVEILTPDRTPYILHYMEGEEPPYAIFESLGENAGSDDDPIAEFETFEQVQQWYNEQI